jgi:hypothetical protein
MPTNENRKNSATYYNTDSIGKHSGNKAKSDNNKGEANINNSNTSEAISDYLSDILKQKKRERSNN